MACSKVLTAFADSELQFHEQFRTIVETTPECIKIVAPDGIILFSNASGLAMCAADSADALVGRSIYDFIAPEYRDSFRAFNQRICQGEKASLQFDMIALNGQRSHVETHAAPLRYIDGQTVQLAVTHNVTERTRSDRAGLLLRSIVDSSDDAIISKDLNGVIMSWNKSAERVFGYTAEEAIGKTVAELLIPEDRQEEEPDILSRLQRGQRVDHFETVRRRKDGTLLDISLTISPVKDDQGTIIGASKIARDVSERMRAERAIQALNQQLTADLAAMTCIQQLSTRSMETENFPQMLDEIVAAIVEITSADMANIQLLEDGALKIVAHHGFDAPFLNFFKNVQQHSAAACATAWRRAERVIVEDVANSPVFADKTSVSILLDAGVRAMQSTPLVTRNGQVVGMLSTHSRTPWWPSERDLRLIDILARQTADLIERHSAEMALLASERRFRQLADMMPQIVWAARPDGYVDYYNERWYDYTGYPRDQFGDASWERLVAPDDLRHTREAFYRAIQSGEPYKSEYRLWDRHENRWRWFLGRALPVKNNQGAIVKWFGTWTDIDDQKRVQEEIRLANQDLEQFAFSASHDLQEPLRAISIYSELLARKFRGHMDADALLYVKHLRTGASRMEALVRDLLAYTRAAKLELPTETVDANEALEAALAALANAISESGAKITAGPLPSVHVHATHLQQIFQNLVGNAIKFRSPDRAPEVCITAERLTEYCTFAVHDNGIGIEPEYKESIFGLFKRLHSSNEYSGTGIGLAICQRIVERYSGRIWVESEPGKGSTFRFSLPA